MKDAYQYKSIDSVTDSMSNKVLNLKYSDFFYNRIGSILYTVYMSYKMGYKSVILCGFDMSSKYFYCTNMKYSIHAVKYGLCEVNKVNKIHNDDKRKDEIIKTLIFMNNKFKVERGGGVFVYTKDGLLSEYLPVFSPSRVPS